MKMMVLHGRASSKFPRGRGRGRAFSVESFNVITASLRRSTNIERVKHLLMLVDSLRCPLDVQAALI